MVAYVAYVAYAAYAAYAADVASIRILSRWSSYRDAQSEGELGEFSL
jgi:hypothetical protein